MTQKKLKIFVVDDESSARLMISFLFSDASFELIEFGSGEECLAALDQSPDVILMDVEMPGMDGISTCRALRDAGELRAHVIFISAHDDMETRLRAYDAGGNDYLVKPFVPAVLTQKIRVARFLLEQQEQLAEQAQAAQESAIVAISFMGEQGVVISFLRSSFNCRTREEVAQAVFFALEQFGLAGLIAFHDDSSFMASSKGDCTPLETSILQHAKSMDCIFQFRDHIVFNYPCVTLVVPNLPVGDPDLAGRLRDHVALIAEGAHTRISAMAGEEKRLAQASGIVGAVGELASALEEIERMQQKNRVAVLQHMNDYIARLECSFVSMGLTQGQEEGLSEMARGMAEGIYELLDEGKVAGDRLKTVTERLEQLID